MAHQTTGRIDELATLDGIAPPVRVEPCAAYRADHASAWPACDVCGWLEDDHAPATAAIVRALPRRGVRLPERMAS